MEKTSLKQGPKY